MAAKPAFVTIKLFVSGGGRHEHPPRSDLILRGWLWLTGGNIHLVRLPSVIFYLLGAWFLLQAARRMGGDRARNDTLILLLWPYGFHLGRLAGRYSFTFLLGSLLAFGHLKYLERRPPGTWMPVVLCALALVDTNYFGWAVLGLLGLDRSLRLGRERRTWLLLLATGLFLLVSCIPIMRAVMTELRTGALTGRASSPFARGIYNLCCLFAVVFDGPSYRVPGPSMEEIRAALSARCKTISEQDLVRDAGAKWKPEYQPPTGQRVWRIRVVTFGCALQ